MKGIIFVCLAIVAALADDDLPSFSWDGMVLRVQYAHGKSDQASMSFVVEEELGDENDDTCIMFGNFEIEDIPVALTGCPGDNTFDISFNSDNTADSVFEVRDGVVTAVSEEEPGVAIDDADATTIQAGDADRIIWVDDPEIAKLLERTDVEDRSVPSEFELTLSLRYDKLFLEEVAKGSHDDAKTKIRSIVNLARTYFLWPSLGSKISLKILEIEYVDVVLQLRANTKGTLDQAVELTAKKMESGPKEADNYHYFSHDTQSGTAGIARGIAFNGAPESGSFCLKGDNKKQRTAISEWMESDAKTSLTFAHEVGHSIGMPHDFCSDAACQATTERNYARPDSKGNACWGNSIMDYYQPTVNKWSTCSKEQKDAWANTIIKIYGQHCKDTSPPKCEDLCPGARCTLSHDTICTNPSPFGGCDGKNSDLFSEFCKKTCGICKDTAEPTTTASPATTAAPVATEAPETTAAPATTAAPVATEAPATTAAPVTTAAPGTTAVAPGCVDLCPGSECFLTYSGDIFCQNTSWLWSTYGGCDDPKYGFLFADYCSKTCGKC